MQKSSTTLRQKVEYTGILVKRIERLTTFLRPSTSLINMALHDVAKRPWFHRVWIIQELAMAKEATMLIGDWSLPWEAFECAWDFVHKDLALMNGITPYDSPTTSASNVFNLILTRAQVQECNSDSFIQVLTRHSHALATDSRDKIFSLVGLSPDAELEVNYENSTSQVFQRTALQILQSSQNVDMLSFSAVHPGAAGSILPSWVPDWRTGDISLSLATTIDSKPLFGFQAAADSKCSVITSGDGSKVLLLGYELDSIDIAGDAMSPYRYVSPFSILDDGWTLEQWQRIFRANSDGIYKATGETVRDVFWKSLIFGTENNDWDIKKLMEPKSWILKLFYSLRLPHKSLPIKILSFCILTLVDIGLMVSGSRLSNKDLELFLQIIYGRRMIKTKNGYIGLASRNVKVGDIIFLLKGGSVPYILRKNNKAADEYIFVGDGYVHGVMWGEAWDSSKCRDIWLM